MYNSGGGYPGRGRGGGKMTAILTCVYRISYRVLLILQDYSSS